MLICTLSYRQHQKKKKKQSLTVMLVLETFRHEIIDKI